MAINGKPPHFALLPYLAQGHLIPMVDVARLLAKRGVAVSILLTPHNFGRVQKVLDRAIASGLSIRVFLIELPVAEAGLPEGVENIDMLPAMSYVVNFFKATALMRGQVEGMLADLDPTCLIADMCFPWATDMAAELRIPRLLFHGTSCFSLICMNVIKDSKLLEGIESNLEYFEIPDLPDKIEITKAQLTGSVEELTPEWAEIRKQIFSSEEGAAGTVANTFHELEPAYVREYVKARNKNLWCVGPVSLCNVDDSDKADRGNTAAIAGNDCLEFLESHAPASVVYVCLGSISHVAATQLKEMGLGLEASGRPFVWVIREASDEFNSWLASEEFEGRVKGKGLLIRGWAPQVLILSHPSVGCFVTHCGWNSTLEGVSAGVPMVTWPVFAEQFCNEKFIVNVIKTGVRAGVEVPVMMGMMDEGAEVQVRREEVKAAVERAMEGGDEGEERRERARRLGEAAKRAVEEGGSSHVNMGRLIQDMVVLKAKYGEKSLDSAKLDENEISSEIVVQ